jgi:hypothetical protein
MEVKASPRLVKEIQRSKIVPSPSLVFPRFKSESRFRSAWGRGLGAKKSSRETRKQK